MEVVLVASVSSVWHKARDHAWRHRGIEAAARSGVNLRGIGEAVMAAAVTASSTADWAERVARTNKEAMRLVDGGAYEDAASLLNEALRLASNPLGEKAGDGIADSVEGVSTEPDRATSTSSASPLSRRLTATCLNNLGCLHTRRGRPRTALACLERAAQIESTLPPGAADSPAGTHLNICAALSGIGAHARAVRHAAHAVEILTRGAGASSSACRDAEVSKSHRGLLAKAYHNLAVESEHLGHDTDALLAYKRAAQAASRAWGPGNGSEVMRSQLRGFLQKARPSSASLAQTRARALARGSGGGVEGGTDGGSRLSRSRSRSRPSSCRFR